MKPTLFSRRHFSQFVLTSAAIAPVMSLSLRAADSVASIWFREFNDALPRHPWLKVFKGLSQETLDEIQAEVTGDWPSTIDGTLFRNGPAQFELGKGRLQHWFDGDGLIQAWRIRDGRVSHRARFVQTSRYLAEREKGQYIFGGFGSKATAALTSPDNVNSSNTSVIHHHNELWSLWEAGSPWRIDPVSLQTKGVMYFSDETAGLPFSAHPRIDATGMLWNFGYVSHLETLILWQIQPNGTLGNFSAMPISPISIPHDFVVTDRHLVILFPPLHYDHELRMSSTFLDSHVWEPDLPTRVLVVDKSDLKTHFWAELPAQWVFHFSNAWEDSSGYIRFDGASAASPHVMFGQLRNAMRGSPPDAHESLSHATQYVIDTKRRTARQSRTMNDELVVEFPTIDPRRRSVQNRWVNYVSSLTSIENRVHHGLFNALLRVNNDSGEFHRFTYSKNETAEEHLFVPDRTNNSEASGWIVGSTLDWVSDQTNLYLFRAENITDGPVAKASVNRLVPLGLHGTYVSNT